MEALERRGVDVWERAMDSETKLSPDGYGMGWSVGWWEREKWKKKEMRINKCAFKSKSGGSCFFSDRAITVENEFMFEKETERG